MVSGLIIETEFKRGGPRSNGMIISSEALCRAWNEGIAALPSRASSSGGVPPMRTVTETRFRRAPWGRKKHLLPLPILSVVLMVTAMASPGLLHMTVTVIDDPNLKFTATVQNVIHPSGPDGKIVGIMTVTNRASTDIRLTVATVRIEALSRDTPPDPHLDTTITINLPLTVRAGTTVTAPFSGPFTGNVAMLRMDDSFRITPLITWFSVTSSGELQAAFNYNQVTN